MCADTENSFGKDVASGNEGHVSSTNQSQQIKQQTVEILF